MNIKRLMLNVVWVVLVLCSSLGTMVYAAPEGRMYYNTLINENGSYTSQGNIGDSTLEKGRVYYEQLIKYALYKNNETPVIEHKEIVPLRPTQGRKFYDSLLLYAQKKNVIPVDQKIPTILQDTVVLSNNTTIETIPAQQDASITNASLSMQTKVTSISDNSFVEKPIEANLVPQKISTCIDMAPVNELELETEAENAMDRYDDNYECAEHYGRDYYQSLLDSSFERNALLSLAVYADFTSKAFNNRGETNSLAMLGTDGGIITFADIFLIARLSQQGKLHIHIPGAVPPNPQFGQSPSEQYLNLLAPTVVRLGLSQRCYAADITGMYKFDSECWPDLSLSIGFQLPIKYKAVDLDLSFDGGKLYQAGFVQQATQRETTITQFFKDFESVEDFFIRAILRPKGIAYVPVQRKFGIGDLSLFAILDVAQCAEYIEGLQFGVTLVTPTAGKTKANTLFEVNLGNGGGVLIDIWSNVLFRSCFDGFNPTFQIGAEFGINKFKTTQRIPQVKMQAQEGLLRDNPTLLVPVFREYRTDPFVEIDSTVPFFADSAISVRMRQGYKMFVGFGNYFYNIFNTRSRLGLYYDYLRTGKTKIFDAAANVVTASITDFTKSSAHRIGWNLSFKASSGFEVALGSQHIVAGKNVAKLNELFATLTMVF